MVNDIYEAKKYRTGSSSWMYITKDEFDRNQKITVITTTEPDSKSNTGYPLFGKWLGIKWPRIITTASAGAYNASGPMFPVENGKKPSDSISEVIRAYDEARGGGWDAHLAPVKQAGILH